MEEKNSVPEHEDLRVHRYLDLTHVYTERAWHILTSRHRSIYSFEFSHDELIDNIIQVLASDISPEKTEKHIKDLMTENWIGERIYDKYLWADEGGKIIKPYKKRRKKWEPKLLFLNKKKEADFDAIWWELVRNYVRQTYQKVFPTDLDTENFLKDHRDLTPLGLEQAIDNYMWDDDDDDDFSFSKIKHGPLAESWRAYLTASLLVWKSKTNRDLERAMEVLEDVECSVKDEFEDWVKQYVMEEYKEWAYDAFDDLLWQITCAAAYGRRDEICDTIDELADAAEEHHEDLLFDFLQDVICYMSTSDPIAKGEAYENLRELYKEVCCHIEDDIIGGFNDDEQEWNE